MLHLACLVPFSKNWMKSSTLGPWDPALGHSEFHPDPPLESESAQAQARFLLLLLKLIGTVGLHRSGCQT